MLSSLRKSCVDFLREEEGATAIEYAVQLAVIAVVIANAVQALSSNANKSFNKTANAVNAGP